MGRKSVFAVTCVAVVWVLSGVLFAGEEGTASLKLRHVSLFKNGIGYFSSDAKLPDGATTVNIGQLPVPSHGTFWVYYPRDVKMELAKEIVTIYHGEENAEHAEQEFRTVFQKQGLPEDIPVYQVVSEMSLIDLIADAGLVSSKSEARRMIQQRAVRIEDQVVEDINATISVDTPQILRVGKRRFLRLTPTE